MTRHHNRKRNALRALALATLPALTSLPQAALAEPGRRAGTSWVPGGGFSAIDIDRADRQDRANRARDTASQNWCSFCDRAWGSGGNRARGGTRDSNDYNGGPDRANPK